MMPPDSTEVETTLGAVGGGYLTAKNADAQPRSEIAKVGLGVGQGR